MQRLPERCLKTCTTATDESCKPASWVVTDRTAKLQLCRPASTQQSWESPPASTKYSQGHNVVSHEERREAIHHLGQHLRHLVGPHLSHKGGKLHNRAAMVRAGQTDMCAAHPGSATQTGLRSDCEPLPLHCGAVRCDEGAGHAGKAETAALMWKAAALRGPSKQDCPTSQQILTAPPARHAASVLPAAAAQHTSTACGLRSCNNLQQ